MVAASFPNLSFENPPGTGPTLLSAVAEPYALSDGDIFTVVFAGETANIVFLETDFADIAAATAAEVGALIALRVDDLNAEDDGGFVRLTSGLTGEDVSLEVQAGGVNDVLLFSTVAVTGETYAGGAPNGWSVTTDTYLVNEHAEFADENGRPEEIFDGDGWISVVVTDTYETAIFDSATTPAPFESFFQWAGIGVITSPGTEQAEFDTALDNFEDFEEEWGSPTYFEFLPVHLETGIDPEDFESDWNHDLVAPTYGTAMFDDGVSAFEDFGSFITFTWIVDVVSVTLGDWVITINGITYVANTGGGSATATAVDLAAQIDGVQGLTAISVSGTVFITPPNYNDIFVVSVAPPSGAQATTVPAVDFPDSVDNWTGNDYNPDFD